LSVQCKQDQSFFIFNLVFILSGLWFLYNFLEWATKNFLQRATKWKFSCRWRGLMKELCNVFKLLIDKDKGVITLESLRNFVMCSSYWTGILSWWQNHGFCLKKHWIMNSINNNHSFLNMGYDLVIVNFYFVSSCSSF
jgi:hypothetical protein